MSITLKGGDSYVNSAVYRFRSLKMQSGIAVLFTLSTLLWSGSNGLSQEQTFDHTDLIDNVKEHRHKPMSLAETLEAQRIGNLLDVLYAACGRYPTTKEGLKVLVSKPRTFKCEEWGIKKGGKIEPYLSKVPKGWNYISENGSSYNIEPSK
jgi:hypothetical protein